MMLLAFQPLQANVINLHKGKILKEKVFVQSDVIVSDAVMVFENNAINVGINEQESYLNLNKKILSPTEATKQLFKKWHSYPLQCYRYKNERIRKLHYTEIGYSIKS